MYSDFTTPEIEYKKDEKLKKEDVEILREWMKKQAHLPQISEMKLIHFLHSNYYNIESSKKSIENYYTTRTHCPEFFSKRNPNEQHLQCAMKTSLITVLPTRTKDNYPILVTKLVDADPEAYDLCEAFKLIDMTVSLTQMQIGLTDGQVMIMDAGDFGLGHLRKCNVASLKKYIFFVQEASPVRLKAVHVVNVSAVTERFSALVRPFIKKGAYEVFFHKGVDGLDGFVPRDALPAEMGGGGPSCEELREMSAKNLIDHCEYFLKEEKEVVDESKRIGDSKYSENFGVHGSFKKLSID